MNAQPGTVMHVVFGESRSYSDWRLWTVAAYVERTKAEEHARLANEWAQARHDRYRVDYDYEILEEKSPFDEDANAQSSDQPKYGVHLLFVHSDPAQFGAESAVMLDHAKAQGWVP